MKLHANEPSTSVHERRRCLLHQCSDVLFFWGLMLSLRQATPNIHQTDDDDDDDDHDDDDEEGTFYLARRSSTSGTAVSLFHFWLLFCYKKKLTLSRIGEQKLESCFADETRSNPSAKKEINKKQFFFF